MEFPDVRSGQTNGKSSMNQFERLMGGHNSLASKMVGKQEGNVRTFSSDSELPKHHLLKVKQKARCILLVVKILVIG